MQQRKDEMLAKRAKIAEMRRQRELRDKEKANRGQGSEGASELGMPGSGAPGSRRADDLKEVDNIIASYNLDGKSSSPGSRASRAGSPGLRGSRPSSVLGGKQSLEVSADDSLRASSNQLPTQLPAPTTSIATQTEDSSVNSTDIVPPSKAETLSYSKGVQTSGPWSSQRHINSADGLSDSDDQIPSQPHSPRTTKKQNRIDKEREELIRQNLRLEIEAELKAVRGSTSGDSALQSDQHRYPARPLTEDEMRAVTSSEMFLEFVEKSSKVIERALDEDYNILADYALDGLGGFDDDEEEDYAGLKGKKGRRIKEILQLFDERWSKKRMISDINFSLKFPELLLASYTKNRSAPQDPAGLVQVWNLHLHSRPEYILHGNSDILTAKFSPFHPSLILGGSYSGQVLLWDTRSRSPLPVQTTPLTGASTGGHTQPIYSINVVGTQNANNIISTSTDGVVCGWTVDMLSQPQEYLELSTPPPARTEEMSPTCMAFPPSDPTSFLIGTEEGSLYPCHRYDRAGAKAGVDAHMRYRGHTAPVMSLSFHPPRGPIDLSDLVLSSSLDWTVKLWKIRPPSSASSTAVGANTSNYNGGVRPGSGAGGLGTSAQELRPILEFAREDVVYDARWSPHRPGVFALVDGAGSVEVWDLCVDTEVPVTKASPQPAPRLVSGGAGGGYVAKSLNKVAWDEKDGKRMAVGGASGLLTVYEVGSELSAEGVKGEEWTGLKKLVGRAELGLR